ncbi:MAG: 3-deoxy-D-manno-octulosonic acid transferase [Prevotella sp.]|nr:3-deoxy-D-manno-octulosonic acid transferase [Prevotella sp.]
MYNIIMYAIQLGVAIASLFNEKVRKMWRGEREAFRILKEQVDPNAQYVWFHAASLGEFEQGRPIIERLRQEYPQYKILLTFYSPSGYEVRKNYQGADIICYMPIDTVTNARRFLRLVRPCMAFFIKYEFWYNFLHILKHRNVPTYSVSSIFRPNQVFFRWYGKNYGRVLRCFTKFFVQNEQSKDLLNSIGITEVEITGDTRFDRVLQIKEAAKELPVVEEFLLEEGDSSKAKVFVAGSSWLPDEEIFIKYFNEHRDWKLIIAPHVIGEDHLQQIESLLEGRKVIRYTEAGSQRDSVEGERSKLQDADVLLINCFGLLSSIYRYGQVAYVGGGFGVGIHNLPEAAVWDIPVFFGPNNERFQEAQELKKNGGGLEIHNYEEFAARMDELTADPASRIKRGEAAGGYVKGNAGATEVVLRQLTIDS